MSCMNEKNGETQLNGNWRCDSAFLNWLNVEVFFLQRIIDIFEYDS
jgi:hypothetical protein